MIEGFIGFIKELKVRNDALFYFGLLCLLLSVICIVLTKTTSTQIHGVNAWFKPFKFAVSLGLYSWTMAWYCHYLSDFNTSPFNWTVIILFGLELLYIIFQASKGELSHYNSSTPTYSLLYSLMGLIAAVVTLYTAYVGLLFFTQSFPELPSYYVWSIRLGILIFVVFSFEGGLMGSRMNHSVGAINDNSNLWLISWSKTVGDLRVAHFIGMHALQLLPLLSFYIFKNTKATIIISILYSLLAVSTLVQALNGKPLITQKKVEELR
ncbi:hypothetical protein [Flavobacterium frigidarium]|uniref:hypothetical protein n=1 Tax=Flavobacterium frigidarium TaxID=99286 RepID=UPI0030D7A640|tara:strand:+ start:204 stop:1001 length:798 start_codon:yes stop_codon:yes gene_type:complete